MKWNAQNELKQQKKNYKIKFQKRIVNNNNSNNTFLQSHSYSG